MILRVCFSSIKGELFPATHTTTNADLSLTRQGSRLSRRPHMKSEKAVIREALFRNFLVSLVQDKALFLKGLTERIHSSGAGLAALQLPADRGIPPVE
jgi:hypothetical protein